MLQLRIAKKWLWLLLALTLVPTLWMLQIEFTYERNVRHGIPADFRMEPQHIPVMWKV